MNSVGSSPLSRGIQIDGVSALVTSRIIPALAGNTSRILLLVMGLWDHPRSRGEYPSAEAQFLTDLGSSPLSRGIHYRN